MKTLKSLIEKRTLLIWMMCMALKECKLEYKISEDDEDSIEFTDSLTDIHGSMTLYDDGTYSIWVEDETYDSPSWSFMKRFECEYMPGDEDSLMLNEDTECNTLLYSYGGISITDSTSIISFEVMIMKAITNALRFRKMLDDFFEADE